MTMRAALFLDFDNIGISFAELDEEAARRFATQPARWLAWFESGAHALGGGGDAAPEPRRILVRRCYLNPVTFGRYRADYTRAAFTVVDCPPLTQRGKTSADVYMVMDVLEALEHKTTFDEFIILSSDADFTPVLLKLRAHDRLTTIIATNVAAAAYKAACDNVVPYERFFEEALGIEVEPLALPRATTDWAEGGDPGLGFAPLLPRVARALRDRVAETGPLTAREVPGVFAAFQEFRNSSWFGCLSLKALMARLLALEPELAQQGDPNAAWSVTLRGEAAAAEPGPGPAGSRATEPELAARIIEGVREVLAQSDRPVAMASAAQRITSLLGPAVRDSQWAGHGSFKALLLTARAPDIAVLAVPPGYVYDPARHETASIGEEESLDGLPGELAAFVRRLAGVTGAPGLSPADYATLFRAVAEVAPAADGNMAELSRAVRDLCEERGARIARSQVNFVLTGFRYHDVDPARLAPAELARAWARNVRDLCVNAQLELTPDEDALVDAWIVGAAPPDADASGRVRAGPDDAVAAPLG